MNLEYKIKLVREGKMRLSYEEILKITHNKIDCIINNKEFSLKQKLSEIDESYQHIWHIANRYTVSIFEKILSWLYNINKNQKNF